MGLATSLVTDQKRMAAICAQDTTTMSPGATTWRPHQHNHTGDHGNHQRPSWFDMLAMRLNSYDDSIDRVHNYRLEYHHLDNHTHLLIAISDEYPARQCHFIEISPTWEPLLQDPTKVQLISEEIYHLIQGGNVPEMELTADQLMAAYGDADAFQECLRHIIFVMSYTPSPSITSSITVQ